MASVKEVLAAQPDAFSDDDLALIGQSKNVSDVLPKLSDNALTAISTFKPNKKEGPDIVKGLADAFGNQARSVTAGLTGGLSEPIQSGMNAGAVQLSKVPSQGLSALSLDNLKAAYQQDVGLRRGYLQENPVQNMLAQGVGMASPMSIPAKGMGLIAKGTGALTAPAMTKAAQYGGKATLAAAEIGSAALTGGAQAGAMNLTDRAILGTTGFQKPEEAPSFMDTVKTGGLLGGFGASLPYLDKGLGVAGKKAVKTFLGPSEEAQTEFLKNPERIKNAKSLADIKSELDDVVGKLRSEVDAGRLTQDQAKEQLNVVNQQIKDITSESKLDFRVSKADMKATLTEAKANLNASFGGKKAQLEAVKSPIQLADDVQTSIQDLKSQVKKGSTESYQILDKDPNSYSVRDTGKVLRQMADELNIMPAAGGKPGAPVTSQTVGVQNELRSFADRLENTPELIPAREVKKILQQIDNSEKAMYGQPGFDSRVSQAYKLVRSKIDESVKLANPEYRAKMQEVSAKTDLLGKALDRFGDSRTTVGRLNSIASRTAGQDRELLSQLGRQSGYDFDTAVDQYLQAQGTLKNSQAMESLKTQLPEFGAVRSTEEKLARMGRPEVEGQFVDQQLRSSGVLGKQSEATTALERAQQRLAEAQGKLEPFKRLGEGNTQNFIESVLKGKQNINNQETLQKISQLSEKDFVQMVNDLRTQRAFQGEYRNGSRNVMLGTVSGGMIGGLFGVAGASVGAGAGATMGGLIDRFGPQMAQQILSQVAKIQKNPTVQAIQTLKLPPAVKAYLINEYEKSSNPLARRKQQLQGDN